MNTHSLFSYDFPKRSIIASAATLKKARNPQSAECKMLLRMMSEHPDFKIEEKTIQKKPGKQQGEQPRHAFVLFHHIDIRFKV